MNYLFAIIGAILGVALVAFFAGMPLADWTVAQQRFESPVDADDMHGWVYLASLLAGLIAGWALGWAIGSRFERDPFDLNS